MLYKKTNAQSFEIPGKTVGDIYPSSPKKDQTIAHVKMDGKYPVDGYSLNDICTETIYVLDGNLNIEIEGEIFSAEKDDICIILPGKKYRITGKGEALDLITPQWNSSQNHIIS